MSISQASNVPPHLSSLENVYFVRDDFVGMNRGMATEPFVKAGLLNSTIYGTQNISNIWRILLLLKVSAYTRSCCAIFHPMWNFSFILVFGLEIQS